MHWLDIVILGTTAAGAIWGAFTGLIWQVSRILGVVVALYATLILNDIATPLVRRLLMPQASDPFPQLTAYALAFVAAWLAFFLLTLFLHRAIEKIKLEWLNRLLGALFGAGKVILVAGIVLLVFSLFSAPREMMEGSRLARPLVSGMKVATILLPAEYREVFDEDLENEDADQKELQFDWSDFLQGARK